jgi:oligosaccharide translocation protein RFT1
MCRFVLYVFIFDAGSQLLARVVTFILNLITARLLDPDQYGISAVQFHLINSSIVFLSREGVRRSCLRIESTEQNYTAKLLSASLIAVPAGLVISLASIGILWHGQIEDAVYRRAAGMQCLAAVLEIVTEPFYVFSTARLWFGVRTASEAVASIMKNFVTVLLLARGVCDPIMAVSWGQVSYACSLMSVFVVLFSIFDPTWYRTLSWKRWGCFQVEKKTLRLYGAFSLQAIGKLVLAEGSKAVLALVTSTTVQGVYGLVNNLGSLVVRTLFQPFEEIVFVSFSKDGSAASKPQLTKQAGLLSCLCQSISIIGGLSACFGPAYAYSALRILYGEKWATSDAPAALGLYSMYVALLALNGTLEAFLHGVASESYLHKNNLVLVAASMIHLGISITAVKFHGAMGLLVADSVNMLLRIGYCLLFTQTYFAKIGGRSSVRILPSRQTVLIMMLSLIVTKLSQAILLPETLNAYDVSLLELKPFLLILRRLQEAAHSILQYSELKRMLIHISTGFLCLLGCFSSVAKADSRILHHMRQLHKQD